MNKSNTNTKGRSDGIQECIQEDSMNKYNHTVNLGLKNGKTTKEIKIMINTG